MNPHSSKGALGHRVTRTCVTDITSFLRRLESDQGVILQGGILQGGILQGSLCILQGVILQFLLYRCAYKVCIYLVYVYRGDNAGLAGSFTNASCSEMLAKGFRNSLKGRHYRASQVLNCIL